MTPETQTLCENTTSHTMTIPGMPLMPYVDHGCEVMVDGRQLWSVSLPGAPGCIVQGATLAEAVECLVAIFPRYLEITMSEFAKLSIETAALQRSRSTGESQQ